jgi:hypothetical protein
MQDIGPQSIPGKNTPGRTGLHGADAHIGLKRQPQSLTMLFCIRVIRSNGDGREAFAYHRAFI